MASPAAWAAAAAAAGHYLRTLERLVGALGDGEDVWHLGGGGVALEKRGDLVELVDGGVRVERDEHICTSRHHHTRAW